MKTNLFKLIETADEVWVGAVAADEVAFHDEYEGDLATYWITTSDGWDYSFQDQEVELHDGTCWAREYDVTTGEQGHLQQLTFYRSSLLQAEDFQ